MTTSDWIAVVGITTTLMIATMGGIFMLLFKLFGAVKDINIGLTNIEITIVKMQVKLDVLWQHHMSKSGSSNRSEMTIDRTE